MPRAVGRLRRKLATFPICTLTRAMLPSLSPQAACVALAQAWAHIFCVTTRRTYIDRGKCTL